jgi:hypothetical protein
MEIKFNISFSFFKKIKMSKGEWSRQPHEDFVLEAYFFTFNLKFSNQTTFIWGNICIPNLEKDNLKKKKKNGSFNHARVEQLMHLIRKGWGKASTGKLSFENFIKFWYQERKKANKTIYFDGLEFIVKCRKAIYLL